MHSPASPTDLTLAVALACVALVLLLGFLLGSLARRLRQPAVIGEITAGIILGPSVLGLLPGDLSHRLFPAEVRIMLSAIAQIGLLLFVFKIGWEFERRLLHRRRATAAAVSVTSVALPCALGAGLALVLYAQHARVHGHVVSRTAFVLFVAAAMGVTAFPVLARLLTDRGLMHTRVGALALACAAVDDVLAWCLLALVSAIVTASSGGSLIQIAGLSAAYVALMCLGVRPLLAILARRLARTAAAPYLLSMLVGGVFLSAYATTLIGIHAIFGAFLFGIVVRVSPRIRSTGTCAGPPARSARCCCPSFSSSPGSAWTSAACRPGTFSRSRRSSPSPVPESSSAPSCPPGPSACRGRRRARSGC